MINLIVLNHQKLTFRRRRRNPWFVKLICGLTVSMCLTLSANASVGPDRLLLATQDWFPYQFQVNGVMAGEGIDKVKCVLREMKQPYRLTMTNWDRAQLLTEVGSQHGFFLASENKQRNEYGDISLPLSEQHTSWFSLSDLEGVDGAVYKSNIGVAALFGSNAWLWLQQNGYLVSRNPRTPESLVDMLLTGEVVSILGNEQVVLEVLKEKGIDPQSLQHKRVISQPLGVYFSKQFLASYPLFLKHFNRGVRACNPLE